MTITNRQKVFIDLQSTIDDNGEKEHHLIKEVGYFFNRDELDVIRFSEKTEDGYIVDHLLSIYPNKVNIKRSGLIEMNQVFILNEMTEGMMQLPYGRIFMETFTQSFTYESLMTHTKGKLLLYYDMILNGKEIRKHRLQLHYSKEEI